MKDQTVAYVGLGSNLDDPVSQVRLALQELDRIEMTRVLARSSFYLSPPLGHADQPDYVNAVAKLATGLSADRLLDRLFSIERDHGRIRESNRWGPRTLDLDLLLYGVEIRSGPRLTLPHPEISKRVFVLAPLLELDPDLVIPDHGHVDKLLAQLGSAPIEKLYPPDEQ